MKSFLFVLFACCLMGCIEASSPTPTDDQAASALVEAAAIDDDGAASSARNCVFVEWCDHPDGNLGTICRVRPSCLDLCVPGDALFEECDRDARAVCGRIVAPNELRGCPP